jgi:hypothetical protein
MATVAIAFPILPGRTEEGRQFAGEVGGPRRAEMAEALRRIGVRAEQWYLQPTPMGDLMIVYMDAEDPTRAFRDWAASDHPFDRWFKQKAGAICGLDFNQPLPQLPEMLFDWRDQ